MEDQHVDHQRLSTRPPGSPSSTPGSGCGHRPATDTDIKRGRARFRGDKVWLPLPPGVQAQLDKGVLQVATEYEAREDLGEGSRPSRTRCPAATPATSSGLSYAVSQGMPREEAAGLTRDQIRARFAEPGVDPDAAGDPRS